MGLTPKRETKSFRESMVNEDGNEVLVCGAQYGSTGVYVSVEFIDQNYCEGHTEEVQEAISSFLPRLNALLEQDNLPIIHDTTGR